VEEKCPLACHASTLLRPYIETRRWKAVAFAARDHHSPHPPRALRERLGRGDGRARLRRRAGDPEARRRGPCGRDAHARAPLAADRLERDGGRDPLGPVADGAARRVPSSGARHGLRPHADPQVGARRAARGRCAAARLRARPATPARPPRRRRGRARHAATARRRRVVQLRAHDRRADPRRRRPEHARLMDVAARHLALLTRTTEMVNSSLDLQDVLEAIAHEVAAALGTDACFVYLYDERADELVLRATHGTRIEDATSAPRMRSGVGITGVAAAERRPIMLPAGAHLDPRFKAFPNLREDEYESILAVPILARQVLEGALNVRTRERREFSEAEIGLLTSIASQVGQSIEHAKLYAQARRRVEELEALARISEAVSESLYLEESLEAIVRTTVESLRATGAALVLEDG